MAIRRRELLRTLGLLGGAYFLPSQRAHSAPGAAPKRLVVYYTYHGTLPQFFQPTGAGGGAASETSFELGSLHTPFAAHRDKLVLLSGLDMPTHRKDIPAAEACGHWYGCVQSLTGNGQDGVRQMALGASIDQHVVAGFKANNGGAHPTRIPGLYVSASELNFIFQSPFFSGRSSPVPVDIEPSTVYRDRLFPDGMPQSSAVDAAAERATAQRKLVLDHVYSEYKAAQSRVGTLERQRLEQHASFISDLSQSLSTNATRGCVAPEAPGPDGSYTGRTNQMLDLVQVALACDITRVACILDKGAPDGEVGFTPGAFGQPDLHQLIHSVDRAGSLANNPDAVDIVKRWHLRNSKNFARLLENLAAVKEPDGTTLLDNSVVLWAGEIAEGNHGTANMHWVLAGSGGGAIKTGRYLAFGDPMRSEGDGDPSAPTTNDLLCSIAGALGVPTTTFGLAEACRGPIAKVFA